MLKKIYKNNVFLKVKMYFLKVFFSSNVILKGLCTKWVNLSTQKTNIGKTIFMNFTVFRENIVKCAQLRIFFYSLDQAGPHFYVFVVVVPEILSTKIPLRRVITSSTDFLKKYTRKRLLLGWKCFFSSFLYSPPPPNCNIFCIF